VITTILATAAGYSGTIDADPWTDIAEAAITATGPREIVPQRYRTAALDLTGLEQFLVQVPFERTPAAEATQAILRLPMPDGTTGRFEVVEAPIMAPALAARYPQIKTFRGQGIDDPAASLRFDLTPHGFHAMVLAPTGAVYIDPHNRGDVTHYVSYYKRDFVPSAERLASFACQVEDPENIAAELRQIIDASSQQSWGTELRTYRTVVAATGEYTTYHGGTVALGMAAIVTAMNRVNGVYERDIACTMQLVPDNDLVVYTNPATDPYTNHDGYAMLGQNQSNLDAVIGTANYDLGHVFSTGGGGIAWLGATCRASYKARGVTGLSNPIGDPFYIDYVAHEMGHQYGANHTFNGNSGACTGGNRHGPTAYEPGSASTIMGYAGICSGQNIQWNSDDYFHVASFDEMVAYIAFSSGGLCGTVTPTGNDAPIVDAGAGGFAIPKQTPFALTGSATDPNSDPMTYCWEEFDLGPAGHPNTPVGNAPIFRTFDPVTTPTRIFPKLTDILSGSQTLGEILPTYNRNLTFRLTVRDNQSGGGGVDYDEMAFAVDASAGPFEITAPNTAVTWPGGSQQTVTWDVANTDNANVNCQSVDILLSLNGGYNFTETLATGEPNDGAAVVTLPNVETTTARIRVEAADNVFLDINDANFAISQTTGIAEGERSSAIGAVTLHANTPNPFNPSTQIAFDLPAASRVVLGVYDMTGHLVTTLVNGSLAAGRHQVSWDGRDHAGRPVASGVYLYQIDAAGQIETRRMVLLK
jgi:hypothetical protein